jgi:hypothetical protein
MGRSGTHWLAWLLNQSPTWTVRCEVGSKNDPPPKVQARFTDRNRYGEVCSWIRRVSRLNVSKRAVILRHPTDILLSWWNKSRQSTRHTVNETIRGFSELDHLLEAGWSPITYNELRGNRPRLQEFAEWLGIEDLKLTDAMVSRKINVAPGRASEPSDLPPWLQEADVQVRWFAVKWGLDRG